MRKGKGLKMKNNEKIQKVCVFYTPKETREIMRNEIQVSTFLKNPALIFGKLIPVTMNYKKDEITETLTHEEILKKVITKGEENRENKYKYLELVTKEMKKLNEEIQKGDFPFLSKIEKMVEDLQSSGYKIQKVEGKINWRLIVGLGAPHPQETSMTLHHIYGIPYIPGSALKGVMRHWAILKFAEMYKTLPGKKETPFEEAVKVVSQSLEHGENLGISIICKFENDENYRLERIAFSETVDMFGTRKNQGKIIFLDAYPSGNINLKIDIMNPHYPDYYSKSKHPGDWQQPKPIQFLAVEDTKFVFYLGIRKNESFDLLRKASLLFINALCEHGIGAKTSLGYGVFSAESIYVESIYK